MPYIIFANYFGALFPQPPAANPKLTPDPVLNGTVNTSPTQPFSNFPNGGATAVFSNPQMAGNFPCSNVASVCTVDSNPYVPLSSATPDSTTFIGIATSYNEPRLGSNFDVFPCTMICDSQVSQDDASLCASRLTVSCSNPCDPVYTNRVQTVSQLCPDGLPFYFSAAAGLFAASNQITADRMALTYAQKLIQSHMICIGNLTVRQVCVGATLNLQVPVTSNTKLFSYKIVSGSLPPGISVGSDSSSYIVFYGTTTTPGNYSFTIEVDDPAGSFMQKQFSLNVVGIATASLASGVITFAYSAQLAVSGTFINTTSWSLQGGSLPTGVSLSSSGLISGTPTASGTFPITVAVSDGITTCTTALSLYIAPQFEFLYTQSAVSGNAFILINNSNSSFAGTRFYLYRSGSPFVPGGGTVLAHTTGNMLAGGYVDPSHSFSCLIDGTVLLNLASMPDKTNFVFRQNA